MLRERLVLTKQITQMRARLAMALRSSKTVRIALTLRNNDIAPKLPTPPQPSSHDESVDEDASHPTVVGFALPSSESMQQRPLMATVLWRRRMCPVYSHPPSGDHNGTAPL